MEKVLRLYKIPDVDKIVAVSGVYEELPEPSYVGQLAIVYNGNYSIYYVDDENGLEWNETVFKNDTYYRDLSKESPTFYHYTNLDGLVSYDVSFPSNEIRIAQITSFTYSATRMGNAPTISGTLMYRKCLDEQWSDRVCVFFNKKFYFIDKIPTSEYNNTDQRYKHQCEFVSENRLLENVYFTNVVDIEHYQGDITKLPMQWLEFSFSGDIDDFIYRLNQSLAYSGLGVQGVGFRVVKDAIESVEDKLITISDTTLKAALDLIYETWGVPYWFDGYTIHIGYSNEQQMSQASIEMPTFQYGAVQSLLSLQKSQSNEIVNRITGLGSEENLPYFYPNKNPNAIELKYLRSGSLLENYARISNPYRTVSLEPSTAVTQGVPNKSYFKFMPTQKTYTYDQFVTINPHSTREVANADDPITGGALVIDVIEPNYNIQMKYFTQAILSVSAFETGVAEEAYAVKYAWVWLKEGSFQNITFVDDWKGLFANYIKGYLKVKSYNITHEQFEHNAKYTTSFEPNTTADIIDLYYTPTNIPYTDVAWSDSVTGNSYEERMPLEINSIPQGTTCLLFMFARKYKTNIYDDELTIFLKNETRFVATHTFLDANPEWSLNGNGRVAHLYQYGIRLNSGVTPSNGDIIYFTREADALPCFGKLLPYSFRDSKDIWLNAKNNYYPKEDGQSFYTFENLYKISCAKEHVENFDDIKPTIKGMGNNESPSKRIDKIIDVTFDQDDNNDLDASGEGYQHDYFFVKLAKTSLDNGFGFNLFDCAIDGQTMKINMADGKCGGCTFDVMVKYQADGLAYNPIGVFDQDTTINGITYLRGTPKRDLTTGRVLTNLKEDAQQDTSAQTVWIALKKDNETFGSYDNGLAVVLPDSEKGQNFIPHAGDSFTIINICLPFAYIVAAEQKLYHALLDYMEKNNPRTWSFNVKFSSIYYKKHYEFMDKWLNESSRVPFIYNNISRKYYVQSYNYKVTETAALPEVTIELQEKVKKGNIYYPVPYNPYADVSVTEETQQKRLKKTISEYLSSIAPQNSEVNNLRIVGDVTLSDGTSLNAQITAINSQIFNNERILTAENTWSKIKKAAEVENLFYDGLFRTDDNKIDTYDATYRIEDDESMKWRNLVLSFSSKYGYACVQDNIEVEVGSSYTFSFIAKADSDTEIYAYLKYFDEYDKEIVSESPNHVYVEKDFRLFVLTEKIPDDAKYAVVCFENAKEDTGIEILISKIMILDQDLTTRDQNGNILPSAMFPSKFKYNIQELLS